MDQDATWYRGRPQPRRHCFRWGPRCPLSKRTAILAFSSPSGKILIVAYYQNYCIDSNQILHNDKDHQMSFMGRSNARHKSKIADGRHLEKIEKSLYLSDYWPSWPCRPLTFPNLKNSRWRRPPFWKITWPEVVFSRQMVVDTSIYCITVE